MSESTESLLWQINERLQKLMQACPPPKLASVGQQAAERMVRDLDPDFIYVCDPRPVQGAPLRVAGSEYTANVLRMYVAAAIDKAVADEREACAKVAENNGGKSYGQATPYNAGWEAARSLIADDIRARK